MIAYGNFALVPSLFFDIAGVVQVIWGFSEIFGQSPFA